MKNKIKSISRRLKRGHLKTTISDFVKNEDGSPKILLHERSKRGIWCLVN